MVTNARVLSTSPSLFLSAFDAHILSLFRYSKDSAGIYSAMLKDYLALLPLSLLPVLVYFLCRYLVGLSDIFQQQEESVRLSNRERESFGPYQPPACSIPPPAYPIPPPVNMRSFG